jgi:hypothetical protein
MKPIWNTKKYVPMLYEDNRLITATFGININRPECFKLIRVTHRIEYRGYTFYINADRETDKTIGVTEAITGLRVLSSVASNPEEIARQLKVRINEKWDLFQEYVLRYSNIYLQYKTVPICILLA